MKAALLLVLVPAVAGADCALIGLAPKLLSPSEVAVPQDGGIVVGAVAEDRGSLASGDVAIQNDWTFAAAKRTLKPEIVALAPGLAVYKTSAEAAELRTSDGTVVAKVTRATEPRDKLAAPKVKAIRYDAPISRRSVVKVEVTLDGEVPAGAIALVLADAQGKPRSWTKAEGTVLTPYYQRDCLTLPNATVPSKKGDRVTLFWVDASGRKSAFTKPMTIK